MNLLREKLERGEKLCGTLTCLTDPALCEIFGHMGYDCIWIDMEHTYLSYKEVLCHLNGARSAGMPALVRVPQNDLTATKKILEMGPEAILFPMVRTAEQVRELIDMTLYPPLGNRGFGPMRAIAYDAGQSDAYVRQKNLEMCRFIQVEHVDCVDNLDEILQIPYLDGIIFGPNDLSGSLGILGNVFAAETVARIQTAIAIARKHKKYVGLSGGFSPETIHFWAELDLDILFAGADWNFVHALGKKTLQLLRQYHHT